ncbi:MAG: helix-turn-helix domain-containing protein [Patescibacteria group bacterium]|jgi:sugar-specific transcriptional regulator TrmB
MEISKKLENFGLNQKQAEVYLACLELGQSSVQKIADITQIKRTSVYDLLQNLINKQLVTQTIKGKKRLFVAEDPSTLKNSIRQKEAELDALLPQLKSMFYVPGVKPRMEYYEGATGVKTVLEKTLEAQEKTLRSILPLKDILDLVGEEFFEKLTQDRIKKGYNLLSLRPESKEVIKTVKKYKWASSIKDKREVRLTPKDFKFSMTMYLYDNIVSIISSKKENFGMIIESEEFAYNQKALFDMLWRISKVLK